MSNVTWKCTSHVRAKVWFFPFSLSKSQRSSYKLATKYLLDILIIIYYKLYRSLFICHLYGRPLGIHHKAKDFHHLNKWCIGYHYPWQNTCGLLRVISPVHEETPHWMCKCKHNCQWTQTPSQNIKERDDSRTTNISHNLRFPSRGPASVRFELRGADLHVKCKQCEHIL